MSLFHRRLGGTHQRVQPLVRCPELVGRRPAIRARAKQVEETRRTFVQLHPEARIELARADRRAEQNGQGKLSCLAGWER